MSRYTVMSKNKRKNVVVIGGGTGTFTVLTGLKKYPVNLTAIVTMSDDGGSTGTLRDELGVLPPGDVRQSLVALSASDHLMRTLMNYRFEHGSLKGHSFGNLLLSALEKITGGFDTAVEKTSDILRTRGRVVPATLDKVTLMAKVGRRTIRGEQNIQKTKLNGALKKLWLKPRGRANPKALAALQRADAIVFAPGNLYASIVPDLLVQGIPQAVRKSHARKILVCNLMTKAEHTKNFTVADYTAIIEQYLGGPVDYVIYNNTMPDKKLLKRYAREGDAPTSWNVLPENRNTVGAALASRRMPMLDSSDALRHERLFRHDPARLGRLLMHLMRTRR